MKRILLFSFLMLLVCAVAVIGARAFNQQLSKVHGTTDTDSLKWVVIGATDQDTTEIIDWPYTQKAAIQFGICADPISAAGSDSIKAYVILDQCVGFVDSALCYKAIDSVLLFATAKLCTLWTPTFKAPSPWRLRSKSVTGNDIGGGFYISLTARRQDY